MYQYHPLPTHTCIRVLSRRRPSPEADRNGSLLEVSLTTIDLANNPPEYHALSYTWGNPHATGFDLTDYFNSVADEYTPANKTPIICDGKTLPIQRNLYDALRELPIMSGGAGLSPSADSESDEIISTDDEETNVWIDAICINQQDPEERASQVKLMDRIYSQAAHTIIWLGRDDGTQSTAAAAEAVSRLASYPRAKFSHSRAVPFRSQDPETYHDAGLEPPMAWDHWRGLAALLKRQWFKRVWIVQEVILSRHLVICCGSCRISWHEFVTALRNIEARCAVMGSRSDSTDFVELGEVAVPLEHNALQLATWRDHYHQGHHPENDKSILSDPKQQFTLETLIHNTWAFHATDPRDKIYGLLGLLDQSTRDWWVVDYEQPVEEVFAYATQRIMEQSKSLDILSCIQDPSVRTTVRPRPSWVPDFGIPYVNMLCNNDYFSAAGPRLGADDFQSMVAWPSGQSDRLRLKQAAILDTILETGNDRLRVANVPNSMMLLDPSWFELALLLPQPYHSTGQSRGEALWRTLCADQDPSNKSPAPSGYAPLFRELVAAMVLVRADLEAAEMVESISSTDAARCSVSPSCSASFSHALQRARERWTEMGWVDTPAEELVAMTAGSPPRLLADEDRYGWLVFTLLKMQILAKTEEDNLAIIPDWDFLEEFARQPSYIMRSKDNGGGWHLNTPPEGRRGFFDSFRQRYGKRKLFYTERGLLGLGPASAQVGDVVCLFRGADGPFVCRREGNTSVSSTRSHGGDDDVPMLRIIGESYVHGIMHGEALHCEVDKDAAVIWNEVEIV